MMFALTKYLEKSSSHDRDFSFTVRNVLSSLGWGRGGGSFIALKQCTRKAKLNIHSWRYCQDRMLLGTAHTKRFCSCVHGRGCTDKEWEYGFDR